MNSLPPDRRPLRGSSDPLKIGNRPPSRRKSSQRQSIAKVKIPIIVAGFAILVVVVLLVEWMLLTPPVGEETSLDVARAGSSLESHPAGPPAPPALAQGEGETPAGSDSTQPAPDESPGTDAPPPGVIPFGPADDPYGLKQRGSAPPDKSSRSELAGDDDAVVEDSGPGEPPVQPLAGGNPFAQLPAEVELSFTGPPGEQVRIPLGTLLGDANDSWSVEIDSDAVDLDGLTFQLEACVVEDGVRHWPISLRLAESNESEQQSELLSQSVNEQDAVAHIIVDNHELCLTLPAGQRQLQLAQLRNCAVQLSDGVHSHSMQLRKHIDLAPVPIDTNEATSTLEFTLNAPPKKDLVFLELTIAGGIPAGFAVEPASGAVSINEELCVRSSEMPVADIGIRLNQTDDSFTVRVMPRYIMNDRKRPLVTSSLNIEINKLSRQLIQNQNAISAAKARLGQIPSEISRVRSIRPVHTTHADILAKTVNGLIKEGEKLESRIRRFTEANPQLQQNITTLKQLLPFANSLNGRFNIHVRVYAKTSRGQIELCATA